MSDRFDKQDPLGERVVASVVHCSNSVWRGTQDGARRWAFYWTLQPLDRKSRVMAHCCSERPLRVQCDGQSWTSHTGPLC